MTRTRKIWAWLTGWYVRYAYYWAIILVAGAASILGNRAARRGEELPSWAVDVIDGSPIVVLILMLHLIIVLGRHHGGSLWRSPAEVRALLDAPEPEWKALRWWNPRRWWLALHLDRLAVMGVAQIGGVVIATVALWVSYGQLRELALLADWSGLEASFFPLVVDAGQMYHVPSGAVYHIENVGDDTAEIVLALRSARPRHFSLRDSMSAMTDEVLGNTYDLAASAFAGFRRPPAEQIVSRRNGTTPTVTDRLPNAHLFDVEGQVAPSPTPTARRTSRADSSGRRSTTSRCTRCVSPTTGCANPTGTRSPPRWDTSSAVPH